LYISLTCKNLAKKPKNIIIKRAIINRILIVFDKNLPRKIYDTKLAKEVYTIVWNKTDMIILVNILGRNKAENGNRGSVVCKYNSVNIIYI